MKARRSTGVTLIELLLSLLVSSVLILGVVTLYTWQSKILIQQSRRTQTTEDGREAFSVITRMLKQSVMSSITITQPDTNTRLIDFTLPTGLAIWPNTSPPFINNAIRLSWTSQGSNSNQILLATAASIGSLNGANTTVLVGDSSGNNTQISAMELVKNIDNSYSFLLNAQTSNINPDKTLKVSFEGLILPRN